MTNEQTIIPWKCHVCDSVFDVTSGGICSKCNKPTCNKHLGTRSFSKIKRERICTKCRSEEPVEAQGKAKTTKFTFIAIAAFLAAHSTLIASNILLTGHLSPYSQHGFGALSTHIVSFIGLSLLVLTIKQRVWRTGGILSALSALLRSCMTSFPDQKVTFGIITLIVSLGSIAALAASWRLETFDLSWWERGGQKNSFKPIFVLLVALVIVGIFLYWGRG